MKYDWNAVEKLARENMEGLVFNSELSFTSQISYISDRIYQNSDCKLVLVAGPSSSGKTTFTKLLGQRLEYLGVKVHTISTDDFFLDREKVPYLPNGLRDYDSLAALDVPRLQETIRAILNGEWVEVPTFDFISGKSKPRADLLRLYQEDIVVVEGIHALNPVFLENEHDERLVRVSIQPRSSFFFDAQLSLLPDDLRLLRRTIRDYGSRGHALQDTIRQWGAVLEAEETYIKPFLDMVDYRVDSTYAYEPFIYKYCIYDYMQKNPCAGYEHLGEVLSRVPSLPLPSIPQESLLNEFVHVI